MPKYSPPQLELIKNTIIDCQIRRLTNIETHARLRELGIEISFATVKNYKAQIKSEAGNWIAKLARSRRGDYIAQYRERVQEVEAVQKTLWDIIAGQTGQRTKVEACGKLLNCTQLLTELYDVTPVVNGMADYINGKYGSLPLPDDKDFNSYGVNPPQTYKQQQEEEREDNNAEGGIYPS